MQCIIQVFQGFNEDFDKKYAVHNAHAYLKKYALNNMQLSGSEKSTAIREIL
jgi:hypothetical protein